MTGDELRGRLRVELGLDTLAALGRALELAGGPLGSPGGPLAALGRAFTAEASTPGGWLAGLLMRVALKEIRLFGGADLLERLREAEGPPWSLVSEAVEAVDVD